MTLGEWLLEWYTTYKVPYLSKNSIRNIESTIRLHVSEELKKMSLRKVRAYDIEKALAPLGSTRTHVYARQVLFSAFDKACKLGLVTSNVMQSVDKIRYKKKTSTALTLSEQRQFLAKLEGSKYQNLYMFYLLTGCRCAEALALRWSDVDYDTNVLLIRGTKNETSFRQIPLTSTLKNLLESQAKTVENSSHDFRLFPVSREIVSRTFKKLCPKHHLHDLRHTFITRCAESGINVSVCQQLVGHATADMTLNVYTHVLDDFKRREIEKFNLFPDLGKKE